jgi:GntR family transcriptional regulator/MocR family aminotransferase
MAVEWSGLSPGLLLTLDRESAEPLRAQLERQLRDAIRTARLCSGERLPSSRRLAGELALSRGLVQECYEQLRAEGYLTSHTGSATRVAATAAKPAIPASTPAAVPPGTGPRTDFAHGVPDLAGFPRSDWLWALREAARTAPNTAFGYGDPAGSRELRDVLSAYLRRVRSACAEVPNTIICSGFGQGLGLVLRVLAASGVRTVAFEDPGYPGDGAIAAARAGMSAVPVPVDEDGIDVEALDASGARAVVLTPAHQWPTGVVLAPDRRLALLDWAAARDATIVEDDYDAEFRYDREPVGALQGLCPDRVVSLGTVSKSLAPSLRLGWMVCPPALATALTEEKRLGDRGSPGLDQLALAMLLESGRYDKHLRRMRTTYGKRRQALVDALAEHAPSIRLTGLAAGFHAVAHLPATADEQTVIARARDRSVGLYGMSRQRSTGATDPPQLVLGWGNLSERAIAEGIKTIADLLH